MEGTMKQPTEEQIAEIKAQAIGIAEGWTPYEDESLDYDEVLRIAWQYLVDTGSRLETSRMVRSYCSIPHRPRVHQGSQSPRA